METSKELVEILTRDAKADRGCGVKEGEDLEAQLRWEGQQSERGLSRFY